MSLGQILQNVAGENWVITQYEKYLLDRDKAKEREALHKITDQPERDRQGTWSASGAGSCGRAQQFTYLGRHRKTPDEKTMNIFANGDYVHLRHQTFGMVAGYVEAAEVPVHSDDYRIRGTLDGMLTNGQGFEIKSINDYGFSTVCTFGPKIDHRYQVNAYMLVTGIESFRVLYENKNTNVMKELPVLREAKIQDQLKEEYDRLNNATDSKRLLPMLKECKNLTGRYRWCPFAQICEGADFDA